MTNLQIDPTHEYQTLRQELVDSKKYVFERPLVIAALAVAGVQYFDKPQHVALPIAVALLTLFNFWFTVNRLQSAGRIIAYIQLVLEPEAKYPWIGWENSLRQYRMWLKAMGSSAYAYIGKRLKHDAVPDGLMYYPAIYLFHGALMGFAMASSVIELTVYPTKVWSDALSIFAVGVCLWSVIYFVRWKPGRLSESVERNRIIWEAVFESQEPKSLVASGIA